jgi:hypothetical protein
VVPTIGDNLNPMTIGRHGDGAERTGFSAEHIGGKLQPGSGRSGDRGPARAAASNRVSEAIRPPFTSGDKLTVRSTKADGLGA